MNKYDRLIKRIKKRIDKWDFCYLAAPDYDLAKSARELVKDELKDILKKENKK